MFCADAGLNTLEVLFERELDEKTDEKGKDNRRRKAFRHGHEARPVILGGREVRVSRPRARTVERKEVVLESHEAVKNDEILTRISKRVISRRFARMTQEALAGFIDKPLYRIDLVVLCIDGVVVGWIEGVTQGGS